MKKFIAFLLAMIMCLSLFACGSKDDDSSDAGNDQQGTESTALADAIAYVKTVYKDAPSVTGKDFQRIGTVPVGTEKFEVVWTADVAEDLVKAVRNADGTVTIDVNDASPEEVNYTLTATITDAAGKSESVSFKHVLPAKIDTSTLTPAQIVDLAYALEDGVVTEETFQLTGVISKIDTAWSPDYQNITVTIKVEGKEDKPIMCYRLKGDGADKLAVGDTITVEGVFKNYKGTIEFDAACVLLSRVPGNGPTEPVKPDMPVPTGGAAAIIDAAYKLGDGEKMAGPATLTGKIATIDTAWSPDYQNITVTIKVEGKESQPIMCYRLKGDGADKLAVGDTITVTGTIKNYKGTIEFDAGCSLDKVVKGSGSSTPSTPVTPPPASKDPAADSKLSVKDAIALGASKEHNTYTEGKYYVTGKITEVYSTQYGNMKITDDAGNILTVYGTFDKDGTNRYDAMATKPVAGDTVTVYGIIGQYNNVAQMKNGWITSHTPGEGTKPTEPSKPADSGKPSFVTPAAGKTYKFAMYQANAGKALYFTGAMDGYYLATSSNAADGVDVTIEAVDGGFRFFFMSNGVKTYIDVVPRDTDPSKVNVILTQSPTAVYTWDATKGTMVTSVSGETWYLGTYGTYVTFSASKVSYIEDTSKIGVSQFPGGFCAA